MLEESGVYEMRKILIANGKGGCGKTTIATTLAAALANSGADVILADADRQGSSLSWLKARPENLAKIEALDWSKEKAIGEFPKGRDALVIDGPGGLRSTLAEQLIAECDDVVVPVSPSAFDWNATEKFVNRISKMKRVKKGKAGIHLIANRVRPRTRILSELETFMSDLGYPVLARLSDRVVYARLASNGESVFDQNTRENISARSQWQPLILAVQE